MDDDAEASSLPVFKRTLKAAAVLAVLTYAAATWLAGSRLDDSTPPARVPVATRSVADDPVSTGSIGRGIAATRLDPCVLPPKP